MSDWDQEEPLPLLLHPNNIDDSASCCSSAENVSAGEETAALQAEIAALESSALAFGQVFPVRQHNDVMEATATAAILKCPPNQPTTRQQLQLQQEQDETEQENSRICIEMSPWLMRRPRRRRQGSLEACHDGMDGVDDDDNDNDRLSAFDVLVVLPFYITCGVMAVLALNGTFFNSASKTVPSSSSSSWSSSASANGNSRRWLLQPTSHLESSILNQTRTTNFTMDEEVDSEIHWTLHGMDDDDDHDLGTLQLRIPQGTTKHKESAPLELNYE
jgi:hypothetical protein